MLLTVIDVFLVNAVTATTVWWFHHLIPLVNMLKAQTHGEFQGKIILGPLGPPLLQDVFLS